MLIDGSVSLAVHTWQEYVQFGVMMFSILDPIGTVITFLALTHDYSNQERVAVINKMSLAVIGILFLAIIFGNSLLYLFGLDIGSFRIAGGLVVFFCGFDMLGFIRMPFGCEAREKQEAIAIVPLAIPLIAGPGAIVAVITETQNTFNTLHEKLIIAGELLVIVMLMWLIFYFAPFVTRVIKDEGVGVAKKIMGLIVTSLAIQIIAEGIIDVFIRIPR